MAVEVLMIDAGSEELTEEQKIQRGRRVRTILDDEAFISALKEVERTAVAQWVDGEDVDARERAHARLTALQWLVRELAVIAGDGVVAEHQQEELRRKQ